MGENYQEFRQTARDVNGANKLWTISGSTVKIKLKGRGKYIVILVILRYFIVLRLIKVHEILTAEKNFAAEVALPLQDFKILLPVPDLTDYLLLLL